MIERYRETFPNCSKLLLVNLELRLNESVNGGELIDLHLVFGEHVLFTDINRFVSQLSVTTTNQRGAPIACDQLTTRSLVEGVTVTRAEVSRAIETIFGKNHPHQDDLLLIVPVNGNGIRTRESEGRLARLSDEVDKYSDAIFGNPNNANHFASTDRFTDAAVKSTPKPIFACSDAHNFAELESLLGKTITDGDNHRHTTWIKADLSFQGLLQTLSEPVERVRIQPLPPDGKQPYHVISKVCFADSGAFPSEIDLNSNLVSIIGPRSSGKSALLAHIAYSVSPEHTERQQVNAEMRNPGPAPGHSWDQIEDGFCTVEWKEPTQTTGRIIYLPQNSLFLLHRRPEEITEKLRTATYLHNQQFKQKHEDFELEVIRLNDEITTSVSEWFRANEVLKHARELRAEQPSPEAVTAVRDSLSEEVDGLRERSQFTEAEAETHSAVTTATRGHEQRILEITGDQDKVTPYVRSSPEDPPRRWVEVSILTNPEVNTFPNSFQAELIQLISRRTAEVSAEISELIQRVSTDLNRALVSARQDNNELLEQNKDLLDRYAANDELAVKVQERERQEQQLLQIIGADQSIVAAENSLRQASSKLTQLISTRRVCIDTFVQESNGAELRISDIGVSAEEGFSDDRLQAVTQLFNLRDRGPYINQEDELEIQKLRVNPDGFLSSLANGGQKLKAGTSLSVAATEALTLTEEVRFVAELEGDTIGGFRASSMTAGKQALFALRLILEEVDEPWPLLIDQPEDDLDSRSIYVSVVKDLLARKRTRQIIMVTHNANLVVGADSEQVIVANRHSDDRKNVDERSSTISQDRSKTARKRTIGRRRSCRPAEFVNMLACCWMGDLRPSKSAATKYAELLISRARRTGPHTHHRHNQKGGLLSSVGWLQSVLNGPRLSAMDFNPWQHWR